MKDGSMPLTDVCWGSTIWVRGCWFVEVAGSTSLGSTSLDPVSLPSVSALGSIPSLGSVSSMFDSSLPGKSSLSEGFAGNSALCIPVLYCFLAICFVLTMMPFKSQSYKDVSSTTVSQRMKHYLLCSSSYQLKSHADWLVWAVATNSLMFLNCQRWCLFVSKRVRIPVSTFPLK